MKNHIVAHKPACTNDRVNHITPLYAEVLEICTMYPEYRHDYEFILERIQTTKHVSRVRRAVEALEEINILNKVKI